MGGLSFSQQRRSSAAQADSVSDRASLPGRYSAGNIGSPVFARPSHDPLRARTVDGHPGHIGTWAETEQPAVHVRPSQAPAWAGPLSGPNLGDDFSWVGVRAHGGAVEESSRPVVGPEGDDAERVADRMADRVMSTSGPMTNVAGGYRSTSTSMTGREAPDLVRDTVRSPGQPLGSGVRAFFEPRFGHDFSQVRVHSGDGARHSGRAIGARAYTVGSHIVLREGSPSPSRLMAHELAHVVIESRGHAVGAQPVVRRAPGPEPAIPAGSNFTATEATLLGQARAALKPKGDAIVGVLIPEGGEPIFLQSGGGQGFSSHIEGKATTVMREQGITRAKLVVELEPCQICDRSTYPGPDVPSGGVTGTASGKQIPMQTSKINTALPRDSKLTVVGPESTGIYEGVGPKAPVKMPTIPAGSDLHPDPKAVQAGPTTTTAPAVPPTTKAAVPPAVEPVPASTAAAPAASGPAATGGAEGKAAAGIEHAATEDSHSVLSAIARGFLEELKSMTPAKVARFGKNMLIEGIKGYATAMAVDLIIGRSPLEEDLAALDAANHKPHDDSPEKFREYTKEALGFLPHYVAVPLAAFIKMYPLNPDFLYEATVQEQQRNWEKFKADYGDSDDSAALYNSMQKQADDWSMGVNPF